MDDFLQRLRQRKIVQWAIAYVAFWFALLQGVDIVAARFEWPPIIERCFILALAIGFCATLVLAWYHGERGAQRAGGMEIMILALLLAIGGGLLWRFGPATVPHAQTAAAVASASAPAASSIRPATSAIAAQPIPAKSIAVLPFENLSNDKDNEYFVAGMQDLILTKLADIGDLKVISRTSTEKYKSRPGDLKTIGQQLGVATILEGSVQKASGQVLINVQLIDTRTDSHVWAQDYTRTLDDIFGVEGDVAEKIAIALKAKLSPAETANLASDLTSNNTANDLFLRAEYQYHRSDVSGSNADVKAAISLYQQAVKADPGFALAWSRLSIAESSLAAAGLAGEDAAQLNQQARADAGQALKLQPGLPAAQLAIGYCDYWGRRDYAAALQAFAAVLAQRPNDVEALKAQGYVWRDQGWFDAAITSLGKAVALDPRNFTPTLELGNTYMAAGRYADAETWFQRALALEPDSLSAKTSYAYAILYGSGDVARALAELQGDTPQLKLARAWLLPYQRKLDEAIAMVESVPDTPGNDALGYSRNIQLAVLYRVAGDRVKARPFFAKGLAEDRPLLSRALGIHRAALLNTVGGEEIATGHTASGMAMIAQAEAILDKLRDTGLGPSVRRDDAAVYAMADRADLAVPVLEKALAEPGSGASYSPLMLWLDPYWDPIRSDPRFQALQQQYAKYKPAVTYEAPPAASSAASSP